MPQIALPTKAADQRTRLKPRIEHVPLQALITATPTKGVHETTSPRPTRRDKTHLHLLAHSPTSQREIHSCSLSIRRKSSTPHCLQQADQRAAPMISDHRTFDHNIQRHTVYSSISQGLPISSNLETQVKYSTPGVVWCGVPGTTGSSTMLTLVRHVRRIPF
ncbi:hypothetical protein CCHOA_02050 [Corynebacterium choanae]|uniref:Uncharacterized protein n=1 Tax=Corynebacterium choanae TaxID=1862358 RepID=A0A3G6J4G9_9CORY|nr:hypothetical protein CCHOA_02050 [Corynebacterium choanae]